MGGWTRIKRRRIGCTTRKMFSVIIIQTHYRGEGEGGLEKKTEAKSISWGMCGLCSIFICASDTMSEVLLGT
jgi:hypothetical protein